MEKTDKLIAAGCYLPFISLVVCIFGLIKKASNSFVIYHVRNGIALFLLSFISIFAFIVPVVGGLLWFVFIAVDIYGIYLSIKGLTNFIPIVTPLGKLMPVDKIYTILIGKPFPAQSAPTTATPAASVQETPAKEQSQQAPASTEQQNPPQNQ